MNQYNTTGHLTKDPELTATPNGTAVCRVRLAVDGAGRGRDEQGRPNVGFINVTQFGAGAQAAADYLKKGSLVAVSGRMEWHSWKDEDNKTRESHQVIGEIRFLGNLRTPQARGRETEHLQTAEAAADGGEQPPANPAPTAEQLAADAPRRAPGPPAPAGVQR
jgi:single stranded DNA-binding protein